MGLWCRAREVSKNPKGAAYAAFCVCRIFATLARPKCPVLGSWGTRTPEGERGRVPLLVATKPKPQRRTGQRAQPNAARLWGWASRHQRVTRREAQPMPLTADGLQPTTGDEGRGRVGTTPVEVLSIRRSRTRLAEGRAIGNLAAVDGCEDPNRSSRNRQDRERA